MKVHSLFFCTIYKQLILCKGTLQSSDKKNVRSDQSSLSFQVGHCHRQLIGINMYIINMDFEAYFQVHNLVSVHLENILGQMTNLNMIFHVGVSVYRLGKIWNSSQFPAEFRNGLFLRALNSLLMIVWYFKILVSLMCHSLTSSCDHSDS